MKRRAGDEAGETLVEILVAVVIMGTAVVAIMGGFTTSILGSVLHRSHARIQTVLREHAEVIESGGYPASCASPTPTPAATTESDGFTSNVTGVQFWNGDNPATFGSCSSGTLANGVAKVSLKAASSDGKVSESLDVFVRK